MSPARGDEVEPGREEEKAGRPMQPPHDPRRTANRSVTDGAPRLSCLRELDGNGIPPGRIHFDANPDELHGLMEANQDA
jgi:hypothetical protein